MGKITINELSDSLKDHIDSKQNATDNLLETNNKTVVGAINELLSNISNNESGKKLIANAIGEPLNSSDTFAEMSNDINNLLSNFKTNMMNSGVTVESGDKFKQLIEKIKGLTEGEGNKGIKYAESSGILPSMETNSYNHKPTIINTNLDFIPTVVFFTIDTIDYDGTYGEKIGWELNLTIDSLICNSKESRVRGVLSDMAYDCYFYLSDVTAESFTVYQQLSVGGPVTNIKYSWYAIGVGEEDTTLRDSLADILENKGVDVTEEDDLASLITKVEKLTAKGNYNIKFAEGTIDDYTANAGTSKVVETNLDFTPNLVVVVVKTFSNADYITFTNLGTTIVSPGLSVSSMAAFSVIDVSSESFTIQGGWSSSSKCQDVQWFAIGLEPSDVSSSTFLNIISATELPPTGVDSQICVITDEPSDILVTYTQLDLDHSKNDIYCLLGGDIQIPNSNSITIVNGNVTQKYNFNGIYQYGAKLYSYIYRNSAWELFTGGELIILSNKTYHLQATKNNLSFKPELENNGLYVCSPKAELLTTKIDLTNYSTAELLFSRNPDMLEGLYFVYSSSVSGSADNLSNSGIGRILADDNSGIADISSLTGSYYIGIGLNTNSSAYGYAGYLMGFKLY